MGRERCAGLDPTRHSANESAGRGRSARTEKGSGRCRIGGDGGCDGGSRRGGSGKAQLADCDAGI